MDPILYVDLRCLQDPNYRVRGIGHHVAALLRARAQSKFSNWKTIGLIDPQSPKLPNECASFVDEVSSSLNPCCDESTPAVFIDGTPMTHDTRFSIRFLGHSAFVTAAVVYDFIPLDWLGYLPAVANRIDYVAKMARLRNFDLFAPISEYTAWRLSELLGISRHRIHVTGASVRRSLYELRDRIGVRQSAYGGHEPYFVAVLAADPRKNPQVVVKALRHLNLIYSQRIPLKIVGLFHDAYKRELLQLAGHAEGRGFLEFSVGISDEELASLFMGAIATIAPSHIEGFSLPVVEAAVCGCPVIASTCAAHLELIDRPEALFPSGNSAILAEKLEALLNEPLLRASLVSSQVYLGTKFHEDEVGRRFWSSIELAVENRRRKVAVSTKKRKPRLAFLSPYPPDESDAAFYTAMTMEAGLKSFHSDLYTDSARPLIFNNSFQDAAMVSLAPLLDKQYNGVISVLGNSSSHTRIFEVFERHGGPCILHDVRLTQICFHRLGQENFLKFATNLLGRSVSMEEVTVWLQDQNPPSLFLERVIERAAPLIVNTVTQQAIVKKRYGVDAHVATCCPTIFFSRENLTRSSKRAARERLGIPPTAFLVSSFGSPTRAKGMDICIVAIELLRSWNIPAEFYFIGEVGSEADEIVQIANQFGISEQVHTCTQNKQDAAYSDFLVASDAGVQLRAYAFGAPSTTLINYISAGLPCVATNDMADSCDAPAYIPTVPDHFSPLHVAEQLALIWESGADHALYEDARVDYLTTHNFDFYGKRLIEILGIA